MFAIHTTTRTSSAISRYSNQFSLPYIFHPAMKDLIVSHRANETNTIGRDRERATLGPGGTMVRFRSYPLPRHQQKYPAPLFKIYLRYCRNSPLRLSLVISSRFSQIVLCDGRHQSNLIFPFLINLRFMLHALSLASNDLGGGFYISHCRLSNSLDVNHVTQKIIFFT
jgi:hypothetical protein